MLHLQCTFAFFRAPANVASGGYCTWERSLHTGLHSTQA